MTTRKETTDDRKAAEIASRRSVAALRSPEVPSARTSGQAFGYGLRPHLWMTNKKITSSQNDGLNLQTKKLTTLSAGHAIPAVQRWPGETPATPDGQGACPTGKRSLKANNERNCEKDGKVASRARRQPFCAALRRSRSGRSRLADPRRAIRGPLLCRSDRGRRQSRLGRWSRPL